MSSRGLLRRRSPSQRGLLLVVRGTWGAILALAPDRLSGADEASGEGALLIGARLLGLRHLAEAIQLARHHDLPPPRWSIAVDEIHALSMFALAGLSPRFRRAAVISATASAVLGALSSYER